MREKDMLWEIADYLKMHPNAAVVNLGCGLNMTGRTSDNGTCRIYNLDFPDVIKSRNEIIPAGEREENIACDLNDFSWMDKIDAKDGAVLYAAGKFGRDKLMKGTLKNMGMNDVSGLFCVNEDFELEGWSPNVKLMSKKSCMQGYYKLDDPNIKGIHRFLAKLCDSLAKMYIYRMDFAD